MTWNKHTQSAVCVEPSAAGREQVSWQPMCRTACDEVSAVPTVLTVTNLCQTLGLRSVHMKSSSVTFTSNDVLSDSYNLGRCHPSYALLSCLGQLYIIMADEVMIQNILAKCDSHTKGQKLLSVVFRPTVLRFLLLRSRLHEPTLCLRSRLHEPTRELISSCSPACIAW